MHCNRLERVIITCGATLVTLVGALQQQANTLVRSYRLLCCTIESPTTVGFGACVTGNGLYE